MRNVLTWRALCRKSSMSWGFRTAVSSYGDKELKLQLDSEGRVSKVWRTSQGAQWSSQSEPVLPTMTGECTNMIWIHLSLTELPQSLLSWLCITILRQEKERMEWGWGWGGVKRVEAHDAQSGPTSCQDPSRSMSGLAQHQAGCFWGAVKSSSRWGSQLCGGVVGVPGHGGRGWGVTRNPAWQLGHNQKEKFYSCSPITVTQ